MRIRNLGTVARALQRLATSETKDRPKAVSVFAICFGSGRERCALASAIGHEPNASEAQDHHGPGGRLWHGRNCDERVSDQQVRSRRRVNAVPILGGSGIASVGRSPASICYVDKSERRWIGCN